MNEKTPILIVGTGAMACLFAARLSAAGLPVKILGSWPEGLRALEKHGVRLVDLDGRERAYPVQVASDPAECQGTRSALVLVKSWGTERAARQLGICLAEEGLALTLQNGLGNRETLLEVLGAERVALGVTTTGATLLEPGRVRLAGDGSLSLGAHARLEPLAEALRSAGFSIEIVPDTGSLMWGKLVINAAINPLTALLGVQNGELLAKPTAHRLMQRVAREAAAVATACGVHLPYPDAVAAVEGVARRTSANFSSMLRDVQRGTPTEIDAINGAIVAAGESRGVPVPVNRTLWQLVKALEPATRASRGDGQSILRSRERLERKPAPRKEKVKDVQFGK